MMNRRDFMNRTLAGLAATRLPEMSWATKPEDTPSAPHWLKNGLIDAGGSHEPYSFLVRRGGAPADVREFYERQQSETVIRRLKEQGIEVFHTHLYKGFGMEAEKREMEDTKRAAEIAHRLGMKVDTYIQWNTLMYETFFAEEPQARNWIQRDIAGQPILLTYSFQQSFRYRPCFANQEYLDYLKKVVRYAVVEVKTDFIHFDNFDLNPEPDSCHCPSCVQGFRERLRSKYSPQQRKQRFGFENADFVDPPRWNFQNPPQKMETISDPAIQEWIDFRCQLMADALKQVALFARSLNPEVVIEINPHGITGGNRAWVAGIDHSRLLKWTDAFWTEEENPAGVSGDGRLISKVRSYKLARTYQNILLTDNNNEVAIAESLAFNQTIGFAGTDPLHPAVQKYIDFYRRNRDLFIGTEDVGRVAVLRSYPSIAYHHIRSQLAAILLEQVLIQTRIPFDLIFDEHLADLSKYKVLILPDAECLTDVHLASIEHFVEQGGGLVATGASGLYDEWRRPRVEPGLRSLVGEQVQPNAYGGTTKRSALTPSPNAVRREHGKGRVAYFHEVQFDGVLPNPGPYFEIDNKYWKLPANWKEIEEAVLWAAKGDLPVRVGGPPYLVANLVSHPAKKRMLLHLVNYDAKNADATKSIEVTFRAPDGKAAREAMFYSPDDVARPLNTSGSPGATIVTVPDVKVYGIVCLTL